MGGATFIGRVVSNRMQKTVVVACSYVIWVPKYKVYEKRVARHMAHDEKQECVVGDLVKIQVCRKLSKHKSYRVADVLRRTPVYDPQAADALLRQRDQRPLPTAVQAAQQRLEAAQQRLEALRRMYDKELPKGTGASLSSSGGGGAAGGAAGATLAGAAAAAAQP